MANDTNQQPQDALSPPTLDQFNEIRNDIHQRLEDAGVPTRHFRCYIVPRESIAHHPAGWEFTAELLDFAGDYITDVMWLHYPNDNAGDSVTGPPADALIHDYYKRHPEGSNQ